MGADLFDQRLEKITEKAEAGYIKYGFEADDFYKQFSDGSMSFEQKIDIMVFKMTLIEKMVKAVSESEKLSKPADKDDYFDNAFSESDQNFNN